ncbi:MAG TPA: energy transducer TonB [Flavobacterium sp.]|nr:energy transducer TonB [Flavobacterium sp.]
MNLFKDTWVDTVFEGRNQEYGAYTMRKENGKVTLLALFIGAFVFSLAISAPVISKMLSKDEVVEDKAPIDTKIVIMDILEPIKQPEEIIEKPIIQKETKTVQEVVKHVPPVIVEKETVEQEITSVDDLKDKIAGSKNIEADLDAGEVVIEGLISDKNVDAEVIDDKKIYTAVEVMPEYPGGINEFRNYVMNKFIAPEIDRDLKGQIIVTFVVEPDGSLSNIKAVRDLGYGTGKEAERVIKSSKKWNPGVQNGRKVRVNYTFPIILNVRGR